MEQWEASTHASISQKTGRAQDFQHEGSTEKNTKPMDGIAASPIGCKFSSRSLFQQEKRAIEGMLTGTITKGCQNISDLSSSFQEIQQKKVLIIH